MQDFLCIDNIRFCYPNRPSTHQCNLTDIDFSLGEGDIGAIIGPSGCGKSTLLQLVAGFLTPSKGEIRLEDTLLTTTSTAIEPNKRNIGMVFQDYALFPHLNVEQNVAFGMKKKNRARVSELLNMVGLNGYERKMPHDMSGGEQQRVAIARAIAADPKVLLMDEPFSGLDANLRERLVKDLKSWFRDMNMTAVIVTHDQREAFAIADYIGVMLDGKMIQWAKPYDLYHHPATPFVANFVGKGRMLPATAADNHTLDSALGTIFSRQALNVSQGAALYVFIRPDDIVRSTSSHHDSKQATITNKYFHGATTSYDIEIIDKAGCPISLTACLGDAHLNIGDVIDYAIEAEKIVTFHDTQNAREH